MKRPSIQEGIPFEICSLKLIIFRLDYATHCGANNYWGLGNYMMRKSCCGHYHLLWKLYKGGWLSWEKQHLWWKQMSAFILFIGHFKYRYRFSLVMTNYIVLHLYNCSLAKKNKQKKKWERCSGFFFGFFFVFCSLKKYTWPNSHLKSLAFKLCLNGDGGVE